jgi:hypothetical protein
MSRRIRAFVIGVGALALLSCRSSVPARSSPAGFPGEAPRPTIAADPAVIEDGKDLAARLFGRDPLTPDVRLLRYVGFVGRCVIGPARANAFHFAITQSDLPYATAFPGGLVILSRGMLFLMTSEAELAVTLSRETCRSDSGGSREFPGAASESVDAAREAELDVCGARLASKAGYDAAAFLHLIDVWQERATSVREKSDLDARRDAFRKLPEAARGGKLLAERFRSSAIL